MTDELTVTLEEDDFVEAYRPAPRPRRLARLMMLLALMLVLLFVALLVRFPDARLAFRDSPFVIGLGGAVMLAATLLLLLLLAAPALRRRAARSTLNDHPGMRDPVHYAFDPEHLEVRSTFAQARYPWAELWDWRETEQVVIIMPTPRNFYVVPKRSIEPASLGRLRGYLARARKRAAP